jgi:hypothetical protein
MAFGPRPLRSPSGKDKASQGLSCVADHRAAGHGRGRWRRRAEVADKAAGEDVGEVAFGAAMLEGADKVGLAVEVEGPGEVDGANLQA